MNALKFNDVSLGTVLPELKMEIDQAVITRNAVASLDFNPIHTSPEWAKEVNFLGEGTTIAHGLCSLSFLVSTVTDWCYSRGGFIRGLDSKFVHPVRPGDTITCKGVVSELHPRVHSQAYVTIELSAENQHGKTVAVAAIEVNLQ